MRLRTHVKNEITVLAARGKMAYSRYLLIPEDSESKRRLLELSKCKSVAPLDCYLGLASLPFKISPNAMLDIAYWAQNQGSYQRVEEAITDVMHVNVNDDTVRLVTNFVGGVVFRNDCAKAASAYETLCGGKLRFPMNRKGVLYILADGAALNTRSKDNDGSTWRENKLGEVFASTDMYHWTDKHGNRQRRIMRKEYVPYIGSSSEFKKHLFACAMRGGYGSFKETVLISDGATWIRSMAEELFPDAQQILDYFHLCENVTTFAKHLFNMNEAKYRPWAESVCKRLKESKYRIVLEELEPLKDKVPGNCPVNLYGYISNNVNNIDYVAYEQKGYFIGSGAIESANKTVLQDRLKRAGMRWNVETAQAMLTLKAKSESGLWMDDVIKPFLAFCFATSNSIHSQDYQ